MNDRPASRQTADDRAMADDLAMPDDGPTANDGAVGGSSGGPASGDGGSGGGRFAGPALWAAVGVAVSVLVFLDPVGIHPVDDWLRQVLGQDAGAPAHERHGEHGHDHVLRAAARQGDREVLFYRNPMDPTVTSPVPAQDEMGMDYLPVYADEAEQALGAGAMVTIDPTVVQNMNVRTRVVERQDLRHEIRTVGHLDYDQARMVTVTTKYDGFVEKVHVNYVGEPVARGQALFDIYSPQLVQTQYELLAAIRYAARLTGAEAGRDAAVGQPHGSDAPHGVRAVHGAHAQEVAEHAERLEHAGHTGEAYPHAEPAEDAAGRAGHGSPRGVALHHAEALVDSARKRLGFWDISPEQILRLEQTGEIFRTLTVTAPAAGLVMKRMRGLEGMAVTPGMEAYHIADITSLWLSVEVFEDQVVWIRPGARADVSFAYFPGETIRGTVEFIEPELTEETRTLTVRIAVPNPRGRLRKGMFATVVFDPVVVPDAVAVPAESVLRTGRRSIVIMALGGGRFEPREIDPGRARGGLVEVRSGLEAGERIVTSSQFLLDSESSLRAAVQSMLSGAAAPAAGHDSHSMHGMDHGATDHGAMEHGGMDHGETAGDETANDPHHDHGD